MARLACITDVAPRLAATHASMLALLSSLYRVILCVSGARLPAHASCARARSISIARRPTQKSNPAAFVLRESQQCHTTAEVL